MTPNNELLIEDFEVEEEVSDTYFLNYEKDRVQGKIDGIEAIKQAIYKMLNTERFQYDIYSGYGVELADLIGKERSYAVPEIERRITEALMRDDRITSVGSFEFEFNKSNYHISFKVGTIYGDLGIESEVAA